MLISERDRADLMRTLEHTLGRSSTSTLMEYLPASGWRDLARLSDLELTESRLSHRIDQLDMRFGRRCEQIEGKIDQLDTRLNGRCDQLDARFDALDSRVNGKIEAVEGKIEAVAGKIEAVAGKIEAVAGKIEAVAGKIEAVEGRLGGKIDSLRGEMHQELQRQFRTLVVVMVTMLTALGGMLIAAAQIYKP